jgi:hypothetical protein
MYTSEMEGRKVKIGSYTVGASGSMYKSLFSRDPQSSPDYDFTYTKDAMDGTTYELSTESIVSYTQAYPRMRLNYSDFAYLKDLGVYPNNRLIVARRFTSPVEDDLINQGVSKASATSPMATLISWVPDNQEFFNVSFGEKWDDAETSFESILNDASSNRDLLSGDNEGKALGSFLAQGVNMIPLRGWSEGLQYAIFRKLGLTDRDSNDLPTGNPNLIRSAQARSIAPKTGQFEGVKATITVKMTVEYEIKFISGVDPTAVYYDIIANALNFGTSNSKFMFNKDALSSDKFASFLNRLGSGDPTLMWQALQEFVDALTSALREIKQAIVEKLASVFKTDRESSAANTPEKDANGKTIEKTPDDKGSAASAIANSLVDILASVVAGVVGKYKIRLVGVLNSLTGAPSTPWHVTIGNPRRPIFSSGDMLVDNVSVTFGKLLGYNDLPSSVKIEIELKNARALGKQEIFKKLNCGKARRYTEIRKDINSTDLKKLEKSNETDLKKLPDTPISNDPAQGNSPQTENPAPTGNPSLTACKANYNKIIRSMNTEFGLGANGIFKPAKGVPSTGVTIQTGFNTASPVAPTNNFIRGAEIFQEQFTTGKYRAQYTEATRCPDVKKTLDDVMSRIKTKIIKGGEPLQVQLFAEGGNAEVVTLTCKF